VLLSDVSFPTFYRSKKQTQKKQVLAVQKQVSFVEQKSSKLELALKYLRRWGGHGGGNRGADSGVLAALCVSYLLKACMHVTVLYRVF